MRTRTNIHKNTFFKLAKCTYVAHCLIKYKNKNTRAVGDTLDLGAAVVVFSLAHYLYFFQALDSLIDTTVMASSTVLLLVIRCFLLLEAYFSHMNTSLHRLTDIMPQHTQEDVISTTHRTHRNFTHSCITSKIYYTKCEDEI